VRCKVYFFINIWFIFQGEYIFSQNYINYLNFANKAEFQFQNGKIDSAAYIFRDLLREYNDLKPKDNLYFSVISFLLGDTTAGLNNMYSFISKHGRPVEYLKAYQERFPKLTLSNYTVSKIKDSLDKHTAYFKDTHRYNLFQAKIDSIEFFIRMDQANRPDPNQINKERDVYIQTQFLNYLSSYGIPNTFVCGDAWLTILFHVCDAVMNAKYIEFFMDRIKEGKACPFTVAILTDRCLTDSTVYGSYGYKGNTAKEQEVIKANRIKIGMSPFYNGCGEFPRTLVD